MTATEVIKLLKLAPLPEEGGYFRQTFRSPRRFSTAIYYLVTPKSFSAIHRLPQDEIFHFYAGDPVELVQFAKGKARKTILGSNLRKKHQFQEVVLGGTWQGTHLVLGGKWALLGTTVAPGFEYQDFELGVRGKLLRKFPRHREIILALTR